MGRLLRTKLISVRRPLVERFLPFQLLRRRSKRSWILVQSLFDNLLKWIGMPKYRIGKVPGLHPNNFHVLILIVFRVSKAEDFALMEIYF